GVTEMVTPIKVAYVSEPIVLTSDIPADTGSQASNEAGTNSAPVVATALTAVKLGVDDKVRLPLMDYFSDPDGDTLTFSLTEKSGVSAWINQKGELVVAPGSGQDGTYQVTITAEDGNGQQVSMTTDVVVGDGLSSIETGPGTGGETDGTDTGTDPDTGSDDPVDTGAGGNTAPSVTGSLGEVSVDVGDKVRLSLLDVFKDAEADELTFNLSGNDGMSAWINQQDELVVAPGWGQDGTYSLSITASDGEFSSAELITQIVVGSGGSTDTGGDSSGGSTNALVASQGILANVVGTQEWGDDVTVTGYDVHGDLAQVAYSEEFTDSAFGVKGDGSRWDGQIDFYEWGGARSEKFVIDFNGDVTDAVLRVAMLGRREGDANYQETGIWKAFDGNGNQVAKGLIGPEQAAREQGSYGIYPIEIATNKAFEYLEITATQFNHGAGDSFQKNYGENSSDFGIAGVEYLRLEPADDFIL
ncbi:Ig-like domain-containing protein, partial [Primorskyibacter sedentarius]|uniref:Ig-like domain-containing protein n=1 Tax=Primorskyibacter sedentarius TaxID=745311 RepID=UPI003EB70ACF